MNQFRVEQLCRGKLNISDRVDLMSTRQQISQTGMRVKLTFFGCTKEFSSITLLEVRTVFDNPESEFGSNPLTEIFSFTELLPKFTTCKSLLQMTSALPDEKEKKEVQFNL